MAEIRLQVEHNGITYTGQIATIEKTALSMGDPVMTAWLHMKWSGAGIGVGGYTLDEPHRDADGHFLERLGTAYGLDHIMRLMETVGVHKWEDLPGKNTTILFEGRGGLGSSAAGIAGLTNGKVLIFKEHFDNFKKDN